jgi:hypothetical protein
MPLALRSFIKRVLSSSNSRDADNDDIKDDLIKQQQEEDDDDKHDDDNDTSTNSAVGHAASNMLSSRSSFVSLPLLTASHSTPVKSSSSLYSKLPRLSFSPTSIKRPSTSSGVVSSSSTGFFQRASRLSLSPSSVANGRSNSESRRSINLLQENTTGIQTPSLSCCSKEVAEDPCEWCSLRVSASQLVANEGTCKLMKRFLTIASFPPSDASTT